MAATAPTRADCIDALEILALAASGFIHGRGQKEGRARLRSAIATANRIVRTGKSARLRRSSAPKDTTR